MHKLERETLARIERWRDVLTRAVEDTTAGHEKRRIEAELAELQQARADTERMSAEQLQELHDRLEANPVSWVEHHTGEAQRKR